MHRNSDVAVIFSFLYYFHETLNWNNGKRVYREEEKRGKLTKRKRKGKEEVSWEAEVGRRKFIHLCLIYSSRI